MPGSSTRSELRSRRCSSATARPIAHARRPSWRSTSTTSRSARASCWSDHGIGAEVRDRFDLVLVDEFQDTNGLQCRLLDALAGPACQRVFVGDACQSIYRFRYADVELFRARGERAALRLPLTGSYRSRPELLAVIGHVFGQRFDERDFEPPHALRTVEPMTGPAIELHLVASGEGATRAAAAREVEATALARRLRELVDDGVAIRRDRGAAALRARRLVVRRRSRARRARGAQPARPRLLSLAAGARPVRLPRAPAQPLRRPCAAGRPRLPARRRLQRRPLGVAQRRPARALLADRARAARRSARTRSCARRSLQGAV